MNKQKPSSQTRDAILRAANKVVIEGGVIRLTLEAVARQAKVSKGGLLYHFPSKEALITGMIEQLNEEFNARIRQEYENDSGDPARGRWLRAFIRATFSSDQVAVSSGLLAAASINPDLLAPNRVNYHQWQQQIERDGFDPAKATLIRLAVDGLWFSEILGFAPPEEPLRSDVLSALISLTQEKPTGDAAL